jgi:hypothetical protein
MTGNSADLSRAAWRKSSYSGSNGGQCVEAATMWRKSSYSSSNGGQCVEAATVWRKSSYSSSNGGQCVEAATVWRKSSYSSSNGGECVEVAPGAAVPARLVAIRDSKDPDGPKLLVTPAQWQAFTDRVKTPDAILP